MRTVIAIVLCTNLGLLAGGSNRERVYSNIYEGLKTREGIVNTQSEPKPAEKSMSYQGYEAERKKLLESNDKK